MQLCSGSSMTQRGQLTRRPERRVPRAFMLHNRASESHISAVCGLIGRLAPLKLIVQLAAGLIRNAWTSEELELVRLRPSIKMSMTAKST
jgi:hypothetical protein